MVRRVWVWQAKTWRKATLVAAAKGGKRTVRIDGRTANTVVSRTFPQKHNGRRAPSVKTEHVPAKRTGPRPPPRARQPPIAPIAPPPNELTVEPVSFVGPCRKGDYRWMLTHPMFDRALHIYNENLIQQRDKTDTIAGGGNACARPYRAVGKAMGVPTGYFGGYASLDEDIGNEQTAKDSIDEAMQEILDHLLAHPGRFDTIYYCTNAEEPDPRKDLIGMGIFHVARDVRVYITDAIHALPARVRAEARRA